MGRAGSRGGAGGGARWEASALRAGAARVALPLREGIPLMGYGARQGLASGVLDPLHVRALWLEDRGSGRLLWIEADLCLLAVSQARGLRRRIAEAIGLAGEEILLGCTHTHSGPDAGIAAAIAGGALPDHVREIEDAVLASSLEARSRALPARLAWGETESGIGCNRSEPGGPLDRRVPVLRVDAAAGRPLAVVFVVGCHPTVLGHDNLAYSADWPGRAARVVEEAWPGSVALFAPGAHADVDPRTRGLLDLAIPDQSRGETPETMEALGREVGEAVLAAAGSLEPRDAGPVWAGSRCVSLPVHGATGDREAHLSLRRSRALAALGCAPDAPVSTAELYGLERERTRGLPPEGVRERVAQVRLYLRDRTAARVAGGPRPEVEVQVLRIGAMHALGLPLECCTRVGLEWQARLAPEPALVVSIANGWLRYLPDDAAFSAAGSTRRTEVLQSTFEPPAASLLLDAAEELARRDPCPPEAGAGRAPGGPGGEGSA